MNKMLNHPLNHAVTKVLFSLFAFTYLCFLFGAVPGLMIPTLGQAVWTIGFSESIAQATHFTIRAEHFGYPLTASIAFGLPAVLVQAFLIKYIHLSDANSYAFSQLFWLGLAFLGALKLGRFLGAPFYHSLFFTFLWMSLPLIWNHADYSMLANAFALLPTYLYCALNLLYLGPIQEMIEPRPLSGSAFFIFLLSTCLAAFMDGYTFVFYGMSAAILIAYNFIFLRNELKSIVTSSILVFISFVFSAYLYTRYIGVGEFQFEGLDVFRGYGVDLTMWLIPTAGTSWILDKLHFRAIRTEFENFGDASVWNTTFSLHFILLALSGALYGAYKKNKRILLPFVLITFFGAYMALGPSLKINSVRPIQEIDYKTIIRPMPEHYALIPTGSAWISEHLPAFKNMRATYRWTGLMLLGLWIINVLSWKQFRFKTGHRNKALVITIIFILMINLPAFKSQWGENKDYYRSFSALDRDLVTPLKSIVQKNDRVLFLPIGNDFLANYLAPKAGFVSFNVGGDKNLALATKAWPSSVLTLKALDFDQGNPTEITKQIEIALIGHEIDKVVVPYFDMLWNAHAWPPFPNQVSTIKNKRASWVSSFENNRKYKVDYSDYFSVISLISLH